MKSARTSFAVRCRPLPLLLLVPALALAAPGVKVEQGLQLEIPDEVLVDQDGRPVRLYSDLVKGKTVAVNFVFTTCTTICSPMTAVFSQLQRELGARLGEEVHLITISLDPRTDTPERLAAYASRFSRRPGWTFLTGPADRVTRVLKALGGFVAEKESHTPITLLGHEPSKRWTRAYGLSTAKRLASELAELSTPREASRLEGPSGEGDLDPDRAARAYFTDTELVDQHGETHRFYSDLVRGKKVLINFAFASCKTACSPITANLAQVQKRLGDQVGRDVRMITVTVDPARDTPERLRTFARKFGAKPGWYFLSGTRENVETVLRKLGGFTPDPEQHLTSVLIGDSRTGTWVKALAMSPPENLAHAVEHLNDPAN